LNFQEYSETFSEKKASRIKELTVMSRPHSHWKLPARWPVWLGVLCIVLLLFSATVQAAHFHADGRLHADCAWCHVAQKTFQSSTPQVLPHIVRPISTVPVVAQPVSRYKVARHCLSNRPPPVGLVVA
jgi:hypothetical protein